jgi:hypothetical protein
MTALLIFAALLLIIGLIGANKKSKTTVLTCEVVQVDRDESYVSWYDEHSRLHQENDGCSDCIRSRAEQLQEQGNVKLIRVELGRRNTGEL